MKNVLLHAVNAETQGYEEMISTELLKSLEHAGKSSRSLGVTHVSTDQIILSMMTFGGASFRLLAHQLGMEVSRTLALRDQFVQDLEKTPCAVILPTPAAVAGMQVAISRATLQKRKVEFRDLLYGILKEGIDRGVAFSQLGIKANVDIEML